MKRSAAVIGPTPQFVRWAIAHDCRLREIDVKDLPATTFKQLRNVRALSDGISDHRVYEGICVHPSVVSGSDLAPKGFPVDEIYQVSGSGDFLDQQCGRCPANACSSGPRWAGCFGWLPADSSWNPNFVVDSRFESETNAEISEDIPELFQSVIFAHLEERFLRAFPAGQDVWYRLWQQRILNPEQLSVLRDLCEQSLVKISIRNRQLECLLLAAQNCLEHGLPLHVELVPAGYSDGVVWKIASHCRNCKCVRESERVCPGCGTTKGFAQERNSKVLGYRPFLLLEHILGEQQTATYVSKYLMWRQSSGGRGSVPVQKPAE